ncbi:hypothetical protein LTR85_010055 [Meristemomyces frigidus]|nr:hypothetical protein LTR85_010055 [Meristemomyces frigidus]
MDVNVRKAEQLFFASNILLVLAHGCSRACMLLNLARIQHRRTVATYAVLTGLGIWLAGSVLGVVLNRLSGPTFWRPVGQDCQAGFVMWLLIHVAGLAVDLGASALGAYSTLGLQMSDVRKVFINVVFSADILVIIPAIYGLAFLHHHSAEIARDPTLHSTPFIMANQVGLWVSMWCRFLEIAHGFRDEMGHATFGHGDKFSQGRSQRPVTYQVSEPKPKKPAYTSARRRRKEEEEDDEIELAPSSHVTFYNASVESEGPQHKPCDAHGILQHRSYQVENSEASE